MLDSIAERYRANISAHPGCGRKFYFSNSVFWLVEHSSEDSASPIWRSARMGITKCRRKPPALGHAETRDLLERPSIRDRPSPICLFGERTTAMRTVRSFWPLAQKEESSHAPSLTRKRICFTNVVAFATI